MTLHPAICGSLKRPCVSVCSIAPTGGETVAVEIQDKHKHDLMKYSCALLSLSVARLCLSMYVHKYISYAFHFWPADYDHFTPPPA